MNRDKFSATHYGHIHKRLLHSIVNMRENFPTTRIIIRKDDFKKRLLMTTPVSTSRNLFCHSYKLEGNIVRPHRTKTHFRWKKRTIQMDHNCRTNCKPWKRTALGLHLVTTGKQSPKPRLNPSAINYGLLHPIRP